MKQNMTIIGFLLVLLAVGLGLALVLPVRAGIGCVITLQLVILAVLGAMTISGDKTGDKSAERPAGRRHHRKSPKPKTEE